MYAALLRDHADELLRAVSDADGLTYARAALTANALQNMADDMDRVGHDGPPARGFFVPRDEEDDCSTCAA